MSTSNTQPLTSTSQKAAAAQPAQMPTSADIMGCSIAMDALSHRTPNPSITIFRPSASIKMAAAQPAYMPTNADIKTSPTYDKSRAMVISSGHYVATHRSHRFLLPSQDEVEPFYLITSGKMVSVISKWENASLMVERVSGAIFRRLPPGTSILQGREVVEKAINDGLMKIM
ncbi:hypothetical protein HD554DRAFT_2169427 [Boletus coccyginus]|nr:hypothetical protein HD554DRAFT_2169427 [Boletus coccyginus]